MGNGWSDLSEVVVQARGQTADTRTPIGQQIDDELWMRALTGSTGNPIGLPAVYGAIRLITSTIAQLPVTLSTGEVPRWLRRPRRYGGALDLYDLIQYNTASMGLTGYAATRCTRVGESWRLDAVNPRAVTIRHDLRSGVVSRQLYLDTKPIAEVPPSPDDAVQGRSYLLHIPYLVTPDHPEGLGPLQAARVGLTGYLTTEAHAAHLFHSGTHSGGRLQTDQQIPPETAERYQERWVQNRKAGKIPVLGHGLSYINDIINAKDAQWVEARQFNQAQVWLMYGIPPDYMGATMTGGSSSLSYSNAQDNDQRFRRNCLAAFTQQIQDAYSLLLPPGRNDDEDVRVTFDYSQWEATGATDTDPSPTG